MPRQADELDARRADAGTLVLKQESFNDDVKCDLVNQSHTSKNKEVT